MRPAEGQKISMKSLSFADRLNLYLHTADEPNEDSLHNEVLIPNNLRPGVPPGVDVRTPGERARERVRLYTGENSVEEEKTWKDKLKIILPHVALICLSVLYTLMGAALFYGIERPNEDKVKRLSLDRISIFRRQLFLDIRNRSFLNFSSKNVDFDQNSTKFDYLSARENFTKNSDGTNFSAFHLSDEDKLLKFYLDKTLNDFVAILHKAFKESYVTLDDIRKNQTDTMWTFTSSLFFSATVITAIGYGHLVPQTTQGRVTCLIFCLIGIPLILVTIADIGRFLSVYIIQLYKAYCKVIHFTNWLVVTCYRRIKFSNKTADLTAVSLPKSVSYDPYRQRVRLRRNRVGAMNRQRPINGTGDEKMAGGDAIGPNGGVTAPDNMQVTKIGNDVEVIAEECGETVIDEEEGSSSDTSPVAEIVDPDERRQRRDAAARVEEDSDATNANVDLSTDPAANDQVSLVFILIVLLGYSLFGAFLLQLWENWSLFEAFYYCVITVLTIGFGDYIPQNENFIILTLFYIVGGLIVTTMCIDLVGSQYIKKIHNFGTNVRNITQQAFLHLGGARNVRFGDVLGYVAYLQKSFNLTADQVEKMSHLPEEYLFECLLHGVAPDLNYKGQNPFIPTDISRIKWIEQPRTLSYVSEKIFASTESLDVTSRCSVARNPKDWYYHMILEHKTKL